MAAPDTVLDQARRQSPCVRNCCLDDAQVCMGCGRELQEILRWREVSTAEREAILQRARARREARAERLAMRAGAELLQAPV
jgi:predicted Fe-S protein YdhL (DUF1289 family)